MAGRQTQESEYLCFRPVGSIPNAVCVCVCGGGGGNLVFLYFAIARNRGKGII